MRAAKFIAPVFAAGLLVAAPFGPPARAGDYAERQILGFSPDGRYFAFEQYGVQDGSGFPYSEIFVIDTAGDTWVSGSPIRKRLQEEADGPDAARKAAADVARPLLKRLKISSPGVHLASNPRTELSADPHRVTVNNLYKYTPPKEDPITFSLSETPISSAECATYSDAPTMGFTLTMQHKGEPPRTLHEDADLPKSRGCALGYAIADILRHENGGRHSYAILIRVLQVGFEGPDTRFIAVTRRLP